jgi:hypothetical protein
VGDIGSISTPKLTIRSGSDLSEGFVVRTEAQADGDAGSNVAVEPGTIVCIDPKNAGALRTCDAAYDRTVAGIVSGAGGVEVGMLMSQEDSIAHGDQPVALSGRVYARVDASGGAIRPGDLLTTSARPGHARRVTDFDAAQGAIIGKAMTPLEDGNGLVLVLVSLQ